MNFQVLADFRNEEDEEDDLEEEEEKKEEVLTAALSTESPRCNPGYAPLGDYDDADTSDIPECRRTFQVIHSPPSVLRWRLSFKYQLTGIY